MATHTTLCLLMSDANITYVHFLGFAQRYSQHSLKWTYVIFESDGTSPYVWEIWTRMQILHMSIFWVLGSDTLSIHWNGHKSYLNPMAPHPMSERSQRDLTSDANITYVHFLGSGSWFCGAILSAITEMDIRNIWIRWQLTLPYVFVCRMQILPMSIFLVLRSDTLSNHLNGHS